MFRMRCIKNNPQEVEKLLRIIIKYNSTIKSKKSDSFTTLQKTIFSPSNLVKNDSLGQNNLYRLNKLSISLYTRYKTTFENSDFIKKQNLQLLIQNTDVIRTLDCFNSFTFYNQQHQIHQIKKSSYWLYWYRRFDGWFRISTSAKHIQSSLLPSFVCFVPALYNIIKQKQLTELYRFQNKKQMEII